MFPGATTQTEIMMAISKGLSVVKFFPAEAMGGTPILKALSAPFKDVRFFPTGGIEPNNIQAYLRLPLVLVCGGSWLVKKALISAGNFSEITQLARAAVDTVCRVRGDWWEVSLYDV